MVVGSHHKASIAKTTLVSARGSPLYRQIALVQLNAVPTARFAAGVRTDVGE